MTTESLTERCKNCEIVERERDEALEKYAQLSKRVTAGERAVLRKIKRCIHTIEDDLSALSLERKLVKERYEGMQQLLRERDNRCSGPTALNLEMLKYINETGKINYVELQCLLCQEPRDEADQKRLRANLYARTNYLKKKGWLKQTADGEWIVDHTVVDRMR